MDSDYDYDTNVLTQILSFMLTDYCSNNVKSVGTGHTSKYPSRAPRGKK